MEAGIILSIVLYFIVYFLSVDAKLQSVEEKRILLDDPAVILSQLHTLTNEVQSLRSQLQDQTAEINSLKQSRSTTEGQIYIVWGKKACPALNGTRTIYSGISAGRQFTYHGSGTNTLCLPHNPDPTPSDFPTSYQNVAGEISGTIFGAEYEFNYKSVAIDDDVPCALCMASRATSVTMIPAKTSCPSGWSVQYTGVLTSGSDYSGHTGTEYLCVDVNPEYLTEGSRQQDNNGRLFYPVRAVCGSLPCPPYKNKQSISCVVCSI
ncbi:short-chain collagen C4-like [Saccostrea cucullata]|uniref:short-chain collagen C4-like n=1 Tax=Saccostrea cuccullata TaxID=36930 RepID=UPI002ED30369